MSYASGQYPTTCPFTNRLDHDWYQHRRSLTRVKLACPDQKPVAAFVLLRIQTLELNPPPNAQRDPRWGTEFGSFLPPYRAHSLMEYGNRIGVFRLLDLLQPLGWTVVASVNGLVAHENPWLVKEMQRRGVELLASGWSASRMISNAIDPDTERAWLQQSVDALSQTTGEQPRAYASQDYGYSSSTLELLSQLGLQVTVDWPNDEQPFWFGAQRQLVNIPVVSELEDSQMVVNHKLQTPAWIRQWLTGVQNWAELAHPGSVMALPLHAWIAGVPHRYTALHQAMTSLDASRFWAATPTEIADYWRSVQID